VNLAHEPQWQAVVAKLRAALRAQFSGDHEPPQRSAVAPVAAARRRVREQTVLAEWAFPVGGDGAVDAGQTGGPLALGAFSGFFAALSAEPGATSHGP
jgi:hypothetical protein